MLLAEGAGSKGSSNSEASQGLRLRGHPLPTSGVTPAYLGQYRLLVEKSSCQLSDYPAVGGY